MDKRQLIEWIESLPDDLSVEEFRMSESLDHESKWEYVPGDTRCPVYMQSFESYRTIRIHFKGSRQGEYDSVRSLFKNVKLI